MTRCPFPHHFCYYYRFFPPFSTSFIQSAFLLYFFGLFHSYARAALCLCQLLAGSLQSPLWWISKNLSNSMEIQALYMMFFLAGVVICCFVIFHAFCSPIRWYFLIRYYLVFFFSFFPFICFTLIVSILCMLMLFSSRIFHFLDAVFGFFFLLVDFASQVFHYNQNCIMYQLACSLQYLC